MPTTRRLQPRILARGRARSRIQTSRRVAVHSVPKVAPLLGGELADERSALRRALLDKVYWPYKVKLHGVQYYSIFIEKFAQPLVMAVFDRTGKVERDQVLEAEAIRIADEVQTEYSLAFSSDISVKFLEAARSGSVSYESFLAFMSREQAIVLLGEVDTSGLAKGPGSFAKNRVSNEVRLETLRFDGHELGTHLTDNLLRPMVQINFGPDAPVPKFFIDVEEAEDRRMRQEGVQAVLSAGQAVGLDYFYRVHQTPRPREGEEVLQLELVA